MAAAYPRSDGIAKEPWDSGKPWAAYSSGRKATRGELSNALEDAELSRSLYFGADPNKIGQQAEGFGYFLHAAMLPCRLRVRTMPVLLLGLLQPATEQEVGQRIQNAFAAFFGEAKQAPGGIANVVRARYRTVL